LSYIPACGRQTLSRALWAGKGSVAGEQTLDAPRKESAQPERTASAARARIMRHSG